MALFQAQAQNQVIASRRRRWNLPFLGLFLAASLAMLRGQNAASKYADAAEAIRAAGLRSEYAFTLLERLTSVAGPRLTGSPTAAVAVELTRTMMGEMGFETWLEPALVQHWTRGVETVRIMRPARADYPYLPIAALGLSVPTPPGGISAPIVEVRSFDELHSLGAAVKGRIVFFNTPMDPRPMDTFQAYGEAVQFRSRGASEAAKLGAAAVLVRSVTLRTDDHPHTGTVDYDLDALRIPAAAISTRGADALSALLKSGASVGLNLELGCRNLEPTTSSNVVGQIRGSERPDEIVLVGGHLDSWDLGTGAHDDGAGCAQAIEVLRLIRESGLKPKRTIRAVMFMNEEFGASGGRDYAASERRKAERHIVAMESDRGGFLPIGFGIGGTPEQFARLQVWGDLLKLSGILWIRPGGGGSDTGPLARQGAVLMGFVPDTQKYFDYHHSALDLLSAVHPRELELGAIVMAIMAYVVAQEGI